MNKNTKKIIFLFLLTLTSFFITGCNGAFQYGFFKSIGALIVALVPIIASLVCWAINSSDENYMTEAGYWCGFSVALTCVLFLIPFFYSPTDGFWFRVAFTSTFASIFIGVFNPLRKSVSSHTKKMGFLPFLLSWGFAATVLFVSIFIEHFWLQIIGWIIIGIVLGIYSNKAGDKLWNSEVELRKRLDEIHKKTEASIKASEKKEAELNKAKKEFDDALGEMIDSDFLPPLTLLPTGNYNIDINEADFIGNFVPFKMIFNLDDSKWLEDATYSFEVDDNIPLGALKNLQNLKNLWLNGYLRIVAKSETKKFIAEKKNTIKSKDKTYKFKGDCLHIVYEDKDTPYFNSDMFFHSDLEKGEGTMALTVAGSLSFVRILLNKHWIFNIYNFFATLESRYPKVENISMNMGGFISLVMSECYETLKNIDEVELPKSISFKENNNAEEQYKELTASKSQKLPTDHLHILHLLGEKEYDMSGYDDVNMSNSEITGCESDAEYEIFKRAIENFDSLFNADPRKSYTNVHFEIEDTYDQFSEYEKNLMIVTALQNKAELRKIWDSGKLLLCAGNKEQGSGLFIKGLGAGGIKITFHAENGLWDLEYRCSPGSGHLKFMLAYNMNGEQAEIKISTKKSKLLTFPIFLRILKYENMIKPFQMTMSLLFGMALI